MDIYYYQRFTDTYVSILSQVVPRPTWDTQTTDNARLSEIFLSIIVIFYNTKYTRVTAVLLLTQRITLDGHCQDLFQMACPGRRVSVQAFAVIFEIVRPKDFEGFSISAIAYSTAAVTNSLTWPFR